MTNRVSLFNGGNYACTIRPAGIIEAATGAVVTPMPGATIAELFRPELVAGSRYKWSPSLSLLTPTATIIGGAGLGAAITAMELHAERPVVWATAQYISFAVGTEAVDIDVTIEAEGHYTSQARCVMSRHGHEILTAHGAFGIRDFGNDMVWSTMPSVPGPNDCPPFKFLDLIEVEGTERKGTDARHFTEFRLAVGRSTGEIRADRRPSNGRFALWLRCGGPGRRLVDAGQLAFLGDFLPMGFADAMGMPVTGTSLDNTIRVGNLGESEWVLLAIHAQQVSRGYGHGHAEIWSEDGRLLASVSQSYIPRSWPSNVPR